MSKLRMSTRDFQKELSGFKQLNWSLFLAHDNLFRSCCFTILKTSAIVFKLTILHRRCNSQEITCMNWSSFPTVSVPLILVTPVELSYDFCGFSNSGLMFFEYINYCHLITVGSFLLLIQIY